MAKPFCRDTFVGHVDSGHVVFIKRSGTNLRVSDFEEDSTTVFSMLDNGNSSKKLSCSRDTAVVD